MVKWWQPVWYVIYLEVSTHTVPLSLSHVDVTMPKTPKATEVTSTSPPSINTTIIDASFFLYLQTSSSRP